MKVFVFRYCLFGDIFVGCDCFGVGVVISDFSVTEKNGERVKCFEVVLIINLGLINV